MNALASNVASMRDLSPGDFAEPVSVDDARFNFRRAFEQRYWFSIGELPALPTMSREQAQAAAGDAYDIYTRSWQPFAWDIYLAEVAAIDAATSGDECGAHDEQGEQETCPIHRQPVSRCSHGCDHGEAA